MYNRTPSPQKTQEAHGACIAHLLSPPKLFKGFLLYKTMLHAKYQCIPTSGSWEEGFLNICYINLYKTMFP